MFFYDQDPFPGRCKSFQFDESDIYRARTKRCLGPEGIPHICQFPEDTVPFEFHSYKPEPPKRWVVPEGFNQQYMKDVDIDI